MESRRSIYIEDAVTLIKEITTSIKGMVEDAGGSWIGEALEGQQPVGRALSLVGVERRVVVFWERGYEGGHTVHCTCC